jgi:hypothetical protein
MDKTTDKRKHPYGEHRLALFLLLLVLPLLVAANDYSFTYTNPSIGDPRAPFVLEYFSLVDCQPCRQFETQKIADLLELVERGRLLIIFRDLPPSQQYLSQGNALFCLQEYPDYFDRRRAAKLYGVDQVLTLPPLSGKSKARYQSCLSDRPSIPVLSHNQESFDGHGLVGTPSFVFISNQPNNTIVRSWSGPITREDLEIAMSTPIEERP